MVMKAMRRTTKPIIWFVALAFVGTIFLAWGMDFTRRPGEKGIIGKAAGQEIREEQYRQTLDYLFYQYGQQNPGQEISDAEARKIRDDAFNTVVSEIVFAKERRRLGLTVPDNELVEHLRRFPPDFLRTNPTFMKDGAFDQQEYMRAMFDPQYGPFWAQVEGLVRPQLQTIKLQEYAISLTHLTDPEVRSLYESAEEKRKIRYVGVRFTEFADRITTVDSSAVEAHYHNHQDDYFEEEKRELNYVVFPKKPSPEDTSVVFSEMMEIRQRLQDGEDFAELARLYSEEPGATESGGDLGWFGRKRMVASFDSAAFALDTGVISEPVATPFGYHLIKVHEKRTVNDSDQVHASHILLRIETSGRTLSDLHLKAQQFLEEAEEIEFDSLAREYDLQLRTTGKFARGESIRGFGIDKNLEEFAFNGKVGELSNIIDKDNFYAVCRISRHHPAGRQRLREIWPLVERHVKMKLGADSALIEIRKIESEIQAGKSLTDAAKTYDREAIETEMFGRFESIPDIGVDPAFHGVAFSLTMENPISPVFKAGRMYCIEELIDYTKADLEKYTEQRDSLYQVVLDNKRSRMYQLWSGDLFEQAQVEDFRYQLRSGI